MLKTPLWKRDELEALLARRSAHAADEYLEFLNIPSMRIGVYVLPAGGVDPQKPHAQDEAYYVVRGRGIFWAAGERTVASPGDTLFVKAGVEHRFLDIVEELVLIVFFSTAVSR